MLSYVRALTLDLSDTRHPSTAPIILCDEACHRDLCAYAHHLAHGHRPHTFDCMQSLLHKAHERMSTASSPSQLYGWRRIYTDASILKAVTLVLDLNPLLAIAALDYAIIIAGTAGAGRSEMVHLLIHEIQLTNFPTPPFSKPTSPTSSIRVENAVLCAADHQVPELSKSPSFLAFKKHHSAHPFIVRGYADDWPALRDHPWGSKPYLKSVSGKGRIIPVEKGSDYRAENWTQLLMSWDEFLESLSFEDRPPPNCTKDVLYLAQHNLMSQFPSLRDDMIIPDYVYASPSSPDYPQYRPPQNEERLVMNVWLGPKGTVSPAHVDPYYNFYVQVHGRKTVWLAPPSMASFMIKSPECNSLRNGNGKEKISNTSLCDVFDSDKIRNDDIFWKNVPPNAMAAILGPGDLLFFPPGWWHAMRSETTSFSLSMWF
ncbi:hypothetical protein BDQ17DRAFT_1357643 [Cyathus striatus]|nr:hypothetical protein BDQ17DRAFT_1357643 [Cyathus striatus]